MYIFQLFSAIIVHHLMMSPSVPAFFALGEVTLQCISQNSKVNHGLAPRQCIVLQCTEVSSKGRLTIRLLLVVPEQLQFHLRHRNA